ncbi:Eco57I restriction-modification methylase domain-containing protein [Cyanobium gracile]|uniref:site-specific DNA-methyltransferase (adenine-specific) n=1 Tax=Cyanobium gracile (strain ATCC 27147 / PCC 6307) TaxID=292564 RepID=K9P4X9_CYAGP|nr:DNA methyltransferase [Cyanobium gracile]AFY28442.1 putative N6-adenine-specific DNA methylase [Cyanobium gracile PCC 6307]
MPRRTPTIDPELRAHQEWLGYLQPVGLVVAPAAMVEAGWVVTRSGSELIERQERYREALEPLAADADPNGGDSDGERGFRELADLLTQHLGWEIEQLSRDPESIATHTKELPELGEVLAPTAVVPAATGDGAQLLVMELPLAAAFDQKFSDGDHLWRASAQERFERLLRETGVEAGLLFNGSQLRLVVAPKGESSGHLTFPLADLAAVSGRLMFAGLDLLLGVSHVFLDPDGYRLTDVLRKSRSFQAVVSNALADQVLAALWELLRGFQQADELSERQDTELLGDLPTRDPQQLYGGLITVLMRLVFLLYAEDEALMPSDAVYEQNYKVSGTFEQLQQDEAEYPDTMEQRFGAWAGLMSLCRLVFDGGGPTADYLPARHGQLFDPEAHPWLETPWISDGVVLALLRNLLIVNGERISYRALDVEQIGSVYEGIMGYAVRCIPGRCIGLKSKPQGAKKQLTTAVDLDALLALPGSRRKAWLEEEAATTLPAKSANALKAAASEAELLEALAPRINRELFDGPQAAGSLVFQPTEERRRSGSHYTPRALTRPIVEEALRPWKERCGGKPTAAQILDLKICDPAMGSGAFLVESCRYLAELLEQAWTREGLPDALKPGGHALGEEPLIYARRLIAQSCLYGVDKNPFAVNLARLSLWLVSLSKDAPFTFVDHALKCGDSLVGMERSEIEKALKGASLQRELQVEYLDQVRQQEARSFALFHADSRNDADDALKRQALEDLNASTAYLRTVGDLLVAAFFNGKKPKDREELRQLYLEATLQHSSAEELEEELAEPLERLRSGEKGIQPLHWQLAFPDVFARDQPGFDVFVGNPPFLGGNKIYPIMGETYPDWLRSRFANSGGKGVDLVCYFFRAAYQLLAPDGCLGLISTSTIAEGDTRIAGLKQITTSQGAIYSAVKKMPWPGVAAVSISIVHICKNVSGQCPASFNSYLLSSPIEQDPQKLASNQDTAFRGCVIYGDGFIYRDEHSEENAGTQSDALRLLQEDPRHAQVLKPLIGGKELTTSPSVSHERYAICFGEMSLDEASAWPELLEVVRTKVKPMRDSIEGVYSIAKRRKEYWWQYGSYTPALYKAINNKTKVLAISQVTTHIAFAKVNADTVFSNRLIVLTSDSADTNFALLQSSIHQSWAIRFGASQDERFVYGPEECFDTFPFPVALLESSANDPTYEAMRQSLEAIGERYHQFRAEIMVANNEGLTSTYNRFHDPAETSPQLLELRRLHGELDQAVLQAYGWSDVPTACGFVLDYLDPDDEVQLPYELQERIKCGELFFWGAHEALAFQAQLRAHGAVKATKKLPWRYRWPDAVRDDVLARLLALNAERYAEEVAQGLHVNGARQAASAEPEAGGTAGKRRGRPAKAAQAGKTGTLPAEQMGLAL